MRVSFLVLTGVIAVCNTSAIAEAFAPATEDEANGVGQNPARHVPTNDTAYETAVKKSNVHGGEHFLSRKHTSPDSVKRRPVVKKPDKKRRTEAGKFESEEVEENESKTAASNKISYRRTEKRESEGKTRRGSGLINDDWLRHRQKPRPIPTSVMYNDPRKIQAPWSLEGNIGANLVTGDHAAALPAKELLKIQELLKIFHHSMKEGLEKMFAVLDKDLRKKVKHANGLAARPVPKGNTRSACIDTGDGSCEGESTDGVAPKSHCSDDSPATTNERGNGIARGGTSKRSDESLSPYFRRRKKLPGAIHASEIILSKPVEKTWPPRIVGDYGMYDRISPATGAGDQAQETGPDNGIYDEKSIPWDYDFYMDRGSAE